MAAKQPAMSPSDLPVEVVLDRAPGPRRAEADELLALFGEVSGQQPVVWAGRIIGFGEYEYRHESGREGISPLLAFASGPTQHTIYLPENFAQRWPDLLAELGPHRASKVCLYLTRLTGVDRSALRTLLERSLAETQSESGESGESVAAFAKSSLRLPRVRD
jgi:hypothetical protein